MHRSLSAAALCLGPGLLFAACSGADGPDRVAWEAVRDTVGDTILVRTVGGSVWGEARLVEEVRIGRLDGPDEYTFGQLAAIAAGPDGNVYALDRQGPVLRAYSADGTYLRDLGRPGEGPGELKQVDSGLSFLPDGRLLVRDPGNARITVFGPDGEYETEWRIRGSSFTSTPLYVDRDGNTYVQQFEYDPEGSRYSLEVRAPDGTIRDTVAMPEPEDVPRLVATREGPGGTSSSSRNVPFWPTRSTSLSIDGEVIVGRSGPYEIEIPRESGGVLRIQKDYEPVAVLPGERENMRERTVHSMRGTDPGWDWDGPAIPDTKPAFRNFFVDHDGRVWVHLYSDAEPIPEAEIVEPEPGSNEMPPLRWREPNRFDVFEPDGTYLGRLEAPTGFTYYPQPSIRGDTMWAVVRDALDVPYLIRFRIVPEPDRP